MEALEACFGNISGSQEYFETHTNKQPSLITTKIYEYLRDY